jgi:hypothetical protein
LDADPAFGVFSLNRLGFLLFHPLVRGSTNVCRKYSRTGLPVALFSRVLLCAVVCCCVLLGSAGAALATLIFFATAIYYAVFEGSVIAVAAHHLFPALAYKWAASFSAQNRCTNPT